MLCTSVKGLNKKGARERERERERKREDGEDVRES